MGDPQVLSATRTVTAFLHGDVTMASAGAFRLGGDLDRDFAQALETARRGIRTMK